MCMVLFYELESYLGIFPGIHYDPDQNKAVTEQVSEYIFETISVVQERLWQRAGNMRHV